MAGLVGTVIALSVSGLEPDIGVLGFARPRLRPALPDDIDACPAEGFRMTYYDELETRSADARAADLAEALARMAALTPAGAEITRRIADAILSDLPEGGTASVLVVRTAAEQLSPSSAATALSACRTLLGAGTAADDGDVAGDALGQALFGIGDFPAACQAVTEGIG